MIAQKKKKKKQQTATLSKWIESISNWKRKTRDFSNNFTNDVCFQTENHSENMNSINATLKVRTIETIQWQRGSDGWASCYSVER